MTCTINCSFCFFFNDTATTEIYTLSLHDALPICTRPMVHHLENAFQMSLPLKTEIRKPLRAVTLEATQIKSLLHTTTIKIPLTLSGRGILLATIVKSLLL